VVNNRAAGKRSNTKNTTKAAGQGHEVVRNLCRPELAEAIHHKEHEVHEEE
jgi:hypothetical protein